MYLDTSVLFKLLVAESDSEYFQNALEEMLLSSSELALTEVWSALLAKERNGHINALQRLAAWSVFNEKIRTRQLILHTLDTVALRKANRLLEKCHPSIPLRTLDAIHISACDLSQDFPLCTTDKRMRDAATILGIPVFPE